MALGFSSVQAKLADNYQAGHCVPLFSDLGRGSYV
jgi:hypothetical protein